VENKICFTVYAEPVPKARARTFFNKKMGRVMSYTPKETMYYENLIAATAAQHRPKDGLIAGPVKLTLRIYRDIPKSMPKKNILLALAEKLLPITKPDSSNVLKSVEDALNGIIYHDDNQICDHDIKKRYSNTPRIEVEIEWEGGK
jgi:Holliday junction resolvase RusA-like endonuclease